MSGKLFYTSPHIQKECIADKLLRGAYLIPSRIPCEKISSHDSIAKLHTTDLLSNTISTVSPLAVVIL